MTLVIGQYDLSTTVVGSAFEILLVPNLADSAGTYAPGAGRADQEDRRLEPGVISEIEDLLNTGLETYDRVFIEVDESVTPRWDNQIETIFYNAARGRVFSHEFTSALNVGTQVRTIGIQTLP